MGGDADTFGALLRRFRVAAGLSQEALAARAGLSARGISDLERGARRAPRRETVELLADGLALAPPERARLAATITRHRKPQPAPAPPPPSPLPLPPTPLLGREREEAVLAHLLRPGGARLVTITGPGGVGKTRLALQVAATLAPDSDATHFVDLAPIRNPNLVAGTIARALGLREDSERPLREMLIARLGGYDALLVLDNFEQIAQAATLLAELLAACARLRLLVTSRVALHLRGEQRFPLDPLALPPAPAPGGPALTPAALGRYAASDLFVRAARAVRPAFAPDAREAATVAAICQRLDGLPLALELAAARVAVLPPAALLARLERRLPALVDGPIDLPARQRTLRDTIAWSYDLLDEGAQTLFRRLAVFAGGCTLEGVEAICPHPGEPSTDLLAALTALVEGNLLRAEAGEGGESRFRMLETIHEYAAERLAASEEADVLRGRHAEYYLGLAEASEPFRSGPEQERWLARLEREHDNLRAALAWAGTTGDARFGLRLAAALAWFWYLRGYLGEGQRRLAATLDAGRGAPAALRAKGLHGAGLLAWARGDYARARVSFEESLGLRRTLGDLPGIAGSLRELGMALLYQADFPRARALLEESRGLYESLGDRAGIAYVLHGLGYLSWNRGDLGRARALHEESLALWRALGDRLGISTALYNLGYVTLLESDYGRAEAILRESLALRREVGDTRSVAAALFALGLAIGYQGEYARQGACYTESLRLYQEIGDQLGIASCLEGFAGLAAPLGQATRALRLDGAADALRAAIASPMPPAWRQRLDQELAPCRRALGEEAAAAARAAGGAMTVGAVVGYALSGDLS